MGKLKENHKNLDAPNKSGLWSINDVRPYGKNPRQISDIAIGKVAQSIKEFGFQSPIIVDPHGVIIAGHTRLRAARALGLTQVPVLVATLSAEKARGLRLADNRTGQEAQWDDLLLGNELAALKELDFDLATTGFNYDEIDRLLALAGGDLPPDSQSPGDKHKVQCPSCGHEFVPPFNK